MHINMAKTFHMIFHMNYHVCVMCESMRIIETMTKPSWNPTTK